VSEGEFTQELLREHRETVGRLDARFVGPTLEDVGAFMSGHRADPEPTRTPTSAR
jgi:hypothetical protein